MGGQGAQQVPPGVATLQTGAGARKVAIGDGGRAAGQWVGVGDLRHHQFDTARLQIELSEERRSERQRVNGRADVVGHPRKLRIRQCPRPAAEGGLGLQDLHLQPGPGADHGGGQSVGSAADDGDVHGHILPASFPPIYWHCRRTFRLSG